ncbi:MAG: DegV family protein [Oscillospiraceae bacterium]|nr:DegV family protein [Oscillospiraceae bacterium]
MIRIITDSAADFEPEELQRLNVACIGLQVRFEEKEYTDGQDLSKARFYELLLSSRELPKTSQASPQILLELLRDALNAGDEAIYITISSGISGTYQNACVTAQLTEWDGCHILDSRNATGGQRLLVEYAVRLRDQGCTAREIVEQVSALRDRIVLYACIDTLENLYKGGRISHTVYTLGSMAQIKPIIRVAEDGSITVPAKAMGMRKGMDLLAKRLQLQQPDPEFPLYVMYTNNRSVAETLAQKLRQQGHIIPDDRIIGVGAAIGAHIGPDACGIVYVEK